jgi:acyl-CoA synthetase (AMP-forming)/AMP-acid ligase II
MTVAGASLNVVAALGDHARRVPLRRALSLPTNDGGFTHFNYQQMAEASDACAWGLRAAGIERGTKTALMVKPGPDLFTLLFGLFKVGAVPVVVDPGMGLSRMLRGYQAVGVEAFIGIPVAQLVRLARPAAFSSVRSVVTVGQRLGWGGRTLTELMEHGRSRGVFPLATTTSDDPLLISFTTGSTGPPKPAVMTHGGVAAMLRHITGLLQPDDGDVTLVTMPVMAIMDLLVGCSAVLAPMDASKPGDVDAAVITSTINAFGCRHMFASPALLQRLVEHGAPLPSLRSVVSGGAPVSSTLVAALRAQLGPDARLETTYGATEALPISSIEASEILAETSSLTARGHGTCIGRPMPGLDLRLAAVVDGPIARWADTHEVAAGDVGEIVIRGDIVSPRYHDAPAANTLHKIEGDWHRTGDLGFVDDVGRLWFAGRKSHRVLTATGPLLSVQVEGIFNAHPDVARSALVGVGSVGEQQLLPVVCIELRHPSNGAPVHQERVRRELRDLARQHALTAGVDTFLFHPSFPVDLRHNAKIKREELAAWARLVLQPRPLSTSVVALRAIPIIGWVLVLVGLLLPLTPLWRVLWGIDVFFSVVVHGLQLLVALPVAKRAGQPAALAVFMTFLLGVTWWKPLQLALDGGLDTPLDTPGKNTVQP